MLIGVDCSHLVEEGRTGTENYLYNLLKNLAVVDMENEYLMYFRTVPSKMFWDDICRRNILWRYTVIDSKVSWMQVGLARATFTDRLDRLLCTWHTLPVIHSPRTKIISVIHDFSCSILRSYPLYASLLLSYRLIGVSDYTYGGIVARVPWRKRSVYRQYEGVDLLKYRKSDSSSIDATRKKYMLDKPFFLSVGTLNPRKNLEKMISAFSLFSEEHEDARVDYVIVGKCAKGYRAIYDFAEKTRFSNRVRFLGCLDDREVVDLYSSALALLFVSKDEGFGLPILEAMACGCTVITSNIASMGEVGGDVAITAIFDDVESITNALRCTVDPDSQNLLTRKKFAGLERVKMFSWKQCAEFLKNIY